MQILSWDVGIINLAFCLIDYNIETKKYLIIDWGIINLTDRDKIKCFQCAKPPTLYQEHTNTFSCKKHSKTINCIIPEFETIFTENNTNVCSNDNKTFCGKKSKYNEISTNMFYCTVHSKAKYKNICNKYKMVRHSNKTIASQSMDDFRYRLINELEKRSNLLMCDTVVVENQPAFKNPRMKTISGTVYDYYMIRGMFDKTITKSKIESVRFMSPSNKLKLANNGDTMELVKLKGDDSKTYKLTKQLGIKYCSEMIKQFPEWLAVFNSHKKKDDLADCFLQGMYAAMNGY